MRRLILPLLLLLACVAPVHAQQLHIYCNVATQTPCTPSSQPLSTGDQVVTAVGKTEANFSQWYGVTGIVKGNGSSATPTAAASGDLLGVIGTVPAANGGLGTTSVTGIPKLNGASTATAASATDVGTLLNVTGLMLGNGAAAPTAYAGSSCSANTFATNASAAGVLTCSNPAALTASSSTTAASYPIAFLTSVASQPTPIAYNAGFAYNPSGTGVLIVPQLNISSLTSGAGSAFLCWDSSANLVKTQTTPACNAFSPASTASPTFTGTVTAATLTATTLEQGGTPVQQLPTIQDTISATTYTLVATDCGRTKYLTSGSATTITVPSSTLAVGCIVVLVMDGAASTLTGSGLTLQLAGTTTTGNRAVVNGGMATLQFVSNTKAFAGGPGVT